MDWANERYVRVYVRDTDDWLVMSWEARALWLFIMRKVDRSGVLETKRGAVGVAAITGMPVKRVEAALAELLEDGCLRDHPSGYVARNFIEAQETAQSDQQRKRESRARRREGSDVTNRDQSGTNRDGDGTFRPASGTDGHARSQTVTDSHSEPSRAEPSLAKPSQTEIPEVASAPPRVKPVKPPSEHTRVRDAWFSHWRRKHGVDPKWGGQEGKRLSELMQLGADEVIRRIGILESSPPSFPAEEWSFLTFCTHIDRLVAARSQQQREAIRFIPSTPRVGRVEPHKAEDYLGEDPF